MADAMLDHVLRQCFPSDAFSASLALRPDLAPERHEDHLDLLEEVVKPWREMRENERIFVDRLHLLTTASLAHCLPRILVLCLEDDPDLIVTQLPSILLARASGFFEERPIFEYLSPLQRQVCLAVLGYCWLQYETDVNGDFSVLVQHPGWDGTDYLGEI